MLPDQLRCIVIFCFFLERDKCRVIHLLKRAATSLTASRRRQNWIKSETEAWKRESCWERKKLRNNCKIWKDSIHTWRQASAGVPPLRWQSESDSPAAQNWMKKCETQETGETQMWNSSRNNEATWSNFLECWSVSINRKLLRCTISRWAVQCTG